MTAQSITCPHCRSQMLDDGAFAGRVVACPTCGGHLQMPARFFQAPAIPVIPLASSPPQSSIAERYRRRPASRKGAILTVVTLLAISGLCFVGSRILNKAAIRLGGNPSMGDWYETGYSIGYKHGETNRAHDWDMSLGSERSLYLEIGKDSDAEKLKNMRDIGPGSPYAISDKYPQRGTRGYAELRRGFDAGIVDGYFGR